MDFLRDIEIFVNIAIDDRYVFFHQFQILLSKKEKKRKETKCDDDEHT